MCHKKTLKFLKNGLDCQEKDILHLIISFVKALSC